MKSWLVCCIVLLSFSDTVAQERTDQSSLETLFLSTQPSDSLHLVTGKGWGSLRNAYDYNQWHVQHGAEPLPETLFLKLVGSEEQLAAAHKRQKKFQLLQYGARVLSSIALGLMGAGILADDDSPHKYRYSASGAFLAAGTGLGLIVGTNRLRKQGLSPADVQAMIDQHNRAVLKDLD